MSLTKYLLNRAIAGSKSAVAAVSNFVESLVNTSPNTTKPVVAVKATEDTVTDIDLALVPKGNGAFLLQVPDGTATGGDKRGASAVDLQTYRTYSDKVASGQYSFSVGGDNRAGGSGSVATGHGNNSGGAYSACLGGNAGYASGWGSVVLGGYGNSNSGHFAVVMGYNGNAVRRGQFAQANQGFASTGAAMACNYVLAKSTNSTTPTRALSLSGDDSASAFAFFSNQTIAFDAVVVARNATGTEMKSWRVSCMAHRGADAVSIIGTQSVTVVSETAGATAWDVSFAPATTSGELDLNVTGSTTETIRFVCTMRTAEVIF